eukprot:12586186-Prorocentrum_lima.AAC.1
MTSSLVGSEMCIRDRFTTAAQLLKAATLEICTAKLAYLQPRHTRNAVALSLIHILTLPTICSV